MRINKYIAHAGICSRRKADDLIRDRRVKVNGSLVEDFSLDISEADRVEVDGEIISLEDKFYYKLNKPLGYISSNYDPHNDKNLESLVKINKRFFTAGRLDMDSRGLMLITNDGDLVNRLIHPKYEVKKEYIVKIDRPLSKREEQLFVKPIDLSSNEKAFGQELILLDKATNTYKVIIHQGFNRQIRRMFGYLKAEVLDLKRIKIGEIRLDDLKEGAYVKLSKEELDYLNTL